MKRKWKWLIFPGFLVILFAALILTMTGGDMPVDVYGDLPEKDVTELAGIVKHRLRSDAFPHFSWRSIKNFAITYKYYREFKLLSVVYDKSNEMVQVLAWQYTNALKRADRSLGYPVLDTNDSTYYHPKTILIGAAGQTMTVNSLGPEIVFTFHKTTNGWK